MSLRFPMGESLSRDLISTLELLPLDGQGLLHQPGWVGCRESCAHSPLTRLRPGPPLLALHTMYPLSAPGAPQGGRRCPGSQCSGHHGHPWCWHTPPWPLPPTWALLPSPGRTEFLDRISSSFSVSGRRYILSSKDYAC